MWAADTRWRLSSQHLALHLMTVQLRHYYDLSVCATTLLNFSLFLLLPITVWVAPNQWHIGELVSSFLICLQLRRYSVPLHSTMYDLGAISFLHTPKLQVVVPGNLTRTVQGGKWLGRFIIVLSLFLLACFEFAETCWGISGLSSMVDKGRSVRVCLPNVAMV